VELGPNRPLNYIYSRWRQPWRYIDWALRMCNCSRWFTYLLADRSTPSNSIIDAYADCLFLMLRHRLRRIVQWSRVSDLRHCSVSGRVRRLMAPLGRCRPRRSASGVSSMDDNRCDDEFVKRDDGRRRKRLFHASTVAVPGRVGVASSSRRRVSNL